MNNTTVSPRDALRKAWAWRKVAAWCAAAYTIHHLIRFAVIIHRVPVWKPDH